MERRSSEIVRPISNRGPQGMINIMCLRLRARRRIWYTLLVLSPVQSNLPPYQRSFNQRTRYFRASEAIILTMSSGVTLKDIPMSKSSFDDERVEFEDPGRGIRCYDPRKKRIPIALNTINHKWLAYLAFLELSWGHTLYSTSICR